jgi:hypothetical protein
VRRTRPAARRHAREGQERNRRQLSRSYRPPVRDGLSRFETFVVSAAQLAGVPIERERPAAIARARELAQAAGLAVADVVRADYQDGGEWAVELVVVPT